MMVTLFRHKIVRLVDAVSLLPTSLCLEQALAEKRVCPTARYKAILSELIVVRGMVTILARMVAVGRIARMIPIIVRIRRAMEMARDFPMLRVPAKCSSNFQIYALAPGGRRYILTVGTIGAHGARHHRCPRVCLAWAIAWR